MDDFDGRLAVGPAQQRDAAALRAQINGNPRSFLHRCSKAPSALPLERLGQRWNASVRPPSTGITCPVVQRARGLARKRMASAQSAGSIILLVSVRSA